MDERLCSVLLIIYKEDWQRGGMTAFDGTACLRSQVHSLVLRSFSLSRCKSFSGGQFLVLMKKVLGLLGDCISVGAVAGYWSWEMNEKGFDLVVLLPISLLEGRVLLFKA